MRAPGYHDLPAARACELAQDLAVGGQLTRQQRRGNGQRAFGSLTGGQEQQQEMSPARSTSFRHLRAQDTRNPPCARRLEGSRFRLISRIDRCSSRSLTQSIGCGNGGRAQSSGMQIFAYQDGSHRGSKAAVRDSSLGNRRWLPCRWSTGSAQRLPPPLQYPGCLLAQLHPFHEGEIDRDSDCTPPS